MIDRFVYLSFGLSVVLVFVGAKFIYSGLFGKVPVYVSLPFIVTVVSVSILASLWKTRGTGPRVAEDKDQRRQTR
jgi:tellurite resistance protein TerC